MRINRALTAVIAGVALSGCSVSIGTGGRSVDVDELESNLRAKVAAKAGTALRGLECPDDLEAEVGQKFRCTLTTQSGAKFGMTVTVAGWNGDRVQFQAQVDETPRSTTGSSGS